MPEINNTTVNTHMHLFRCIVLKWNSGKSDSPKFELEIIKNFLKWQYHN